MIAPSPRRHRARSHLEPVVLAGPEALAEFDAWFWTQLDTDFGPVSDHLSTRCWPWTGRTDDAGYGAFSWRGHKMLAHRIALELSVGPIVDGRITRHDCDNPLCARPSHLRPGTHLQNALDASTRGRPRGASGEAHHRSILCDFTVRLIRSSDLPNRFLAQLCNVSDSVISSVRRGRSWRDTDPDVVAELRAESDAEFIRRRRMAPEIAAQFLQFRGAAPTGAPDPQ